MTAAPYHSSDTSSRYSYPDYSDIPFSMIMESQFGEATPEGGQISMNESPPTAPDTASIAASDGGSWIKGNNGRGRFGFVVARPGRDWWGLSLRCW